MKKILSTTVLIILILSMAGCKKTASNNEDFIQIAREEIPVADAETIDIQIIASVDKDNRSFVCYMTGNETQSRSYYALEFKNKGNARYEFVKLYKSMERGSDIYIQSWRDGYVFIVNNDACMNIQLSYPEGETQLIEVGKLPFLHYAEPTPLEYKFLDSEGNIIY